MWYQVNNSLYYEVLELEKNATVDEVKKGYRKMALRSPALLLSCGAWGGGLRVKRWRSR